MSLAEVARRANDAFSWVLQTCCFRRVVSHGVLAVGAWVVTERRRALRTVMTSRTFDRFTRACWAVAAGRALSALTRQSKARALRVSTARTGKLARVHGTGLTVVARLAMSRLQLTISRCSLRAAETLRTGNTLAKRSQHVKLGARAIDCARRTWLLFLMFSLHGANEALLAAVSPSEHVASTC